MKGKPVMPSVFYLRKAGSFSRFLHMMGIGEEDR